MRFIAMAGVREILAFGAIAFWLLSCLFIEP